MKNLIILFVLILNVMPVFAYTVTTQHPYYYRNPYLSPYNYNNSYYRNIPNSNLSNLEKYAMRKCYSNESDISRLERLESLAFGSIQDGDIVTRYKNVENAILSRPQNNYRRSILNTIGNYFSGQATGITPSFMPNYSTGMYNSYTPGFSGSRIDQFSNGIFGGGYRVINENFSSGNSVKILD
ncbi:MAG: hypothetical protein MJ231_01155 [bacterium]|nr:hypothetical protein [bacterium]